MAETPVISLKFDGGSPDPGARIAQLPRPLPLIGDDFDWSARDFAGFRDFMLQELKARFPQRQRWTAADVEVTIIEALAAGLDRLSDSADRAMAESFLQTARRPESVYQWLSLIGYPDFKVDDGTNVTQENIIAKWQKDPGTMEQDRSAGLSRIKTQRRAVSLEDCTTTLLEHPLVVQARAIVTWKGAWPVTWITLAVLSDLSLEDEIVFGKDQPNEKMKTDIKKFHDVRGIPLPELDSNPTVRRILEFATDDYRMAGHQTVLRDAKRVGIDLAFSVHLDRTFFQSEIRHEIDRVLGRGPDGFFRRRSHTPDSSPGEPLGREPLTLGQDLCLGDIYECLTAIDGVVRVDVTKFGRSDAGDSDRRSEGYIPIDPDEYAVCDNDSAKPQSGSMHFTFTGGQRA